MEEEDKEVKLYGFWASPFVHRIEWALQMKGIKYEYIEEDVINNKSNSLLQYNPVYKKVPVLVHGGNPISESTIILEYIEQLWPHNPRLLSQNPYERAMARFWIHFGEEMWPIFRAVMKANTVDEKENAKRDAIGMMKSLEEGGLGDRTFFDGDSIGLVDISFGWMTYFLEAFEEAVGVKLLEPSVLPRLHAWAQRFKELPIVKENHPNHEKLVDHIRRVRERLLLASTSPNP
ncbi:glutathione transferase GST 23-like [Impatiens glandulifera]|uniref:glutathione transferase GST 23-like n=1 Tax=Impatiens glandulifera TaxID=253017 RepID=UPI001FB0C8A0|nr:glutathione transferase GST 23-like [Impatiens glandulifera]